MKKLRFAVLGTGFWANYQIPAWQELEGVELVAVYNRTRSKAETIAKRFGVPRVYDDVTELLQQEELDFVDIITDVDTHPVFVKLAAERGLDVICQKPMASSLNQAQAMVDGCRQAGVKLFIHENFRWQAPIRAVKKAIDSGVIGRPFKARVSFCSGFPVFENQPFLAELEQFILTDIGSHVLDVCRFLFGEAKSLYCLAKRVNPKIKGEDVANVLMEMESGLHCYAEMSYASILEKEAFPQTLVLVEGEKGSIWLTNDFELKVTTREGTTSEFIKPDLYSWVDMDYAVVHSSIVDCNRDILNGLRGGTSETTGEDNFRTMQLVWGSYQSAAEGRVLIL
ncbi:Gfo/Idh/MocA family oxidoreductase [Telluribacter sp.]|jgi:predicted dehydrogenase|uniref:Gfo/Idh/MocA family protein n=1 Tax=Telluribacter sp. TaxID=1978767 RepID=UPI002E1415F7|nr:Gfo/Idh/MocA family oxidoreductase [Telluribacter sp.]